MDMAELAARTGLPVRKLRYTYDHRLLPGLRGTSPGQGVPRTLTDFEGFSIALAARLLDAGLTRQLVVAGLGVACRPTGSPGRLSEVPLLRAYSMAAGGLEIGDARYVRVYAPRRPGLGGAFDTGWVPVAPSGPVPADYTPAVLVAAELGGLARAVQARRPAAGRT